MRKPFKKTNSSRPPSPGRKPGGGFGAKPDGFSSPKRFKPGRAPNRSDDSTSRPPRSFGDSGPREGGRPGGDRPYGGDRPPYGGGRPSGDRPYGGGRPSGDRPYGGGRPGGDRPYGGGRPGGDRPYGGGRPGGDRPYGGGRGGDDRPYGGDRGPRRFDDRRDDRPRRSFDRGEDRPARPRRDPAEDLQARLDALLEALQSTLESGEHAEYLPAIQTISEEYEVNDVAAALLFLSLKGGRQERPPVREREPRQPREGRAQAEEGMARLFISVGRGDGVRPGDLVGAIAGEAGLDGKVIGAIDILEDISFVEVPEEEAENVIQALSTANIRGKRVQVDFAKPGGGGGGGDRRGGGGRPPRRPRY